jgi:hypothetical protein
MNRRFYGDTTKSTASGVKACTLKTKTDLWSYFSQLRQEATLKKIEGRCERVVSSSLENDGGYSVGDH